MNSEYTRIRIRHDGWHTEITNWNTGGMDGPTTVMQAQAYRIGMQSYRIGMQSYRTGMESYRTGMESYRTGMESYRTGMESYRTGMESYRTGMESYHTGMESYRTGMESYRTGMESYRTGMELYRTSTQSYRTGMLGRRASNRHIGGVETWRPRRVSVQRNYWVQPVLPLAQAVQPVQSHPMQLWLPVQCQPIQQPTPVQQPIRLQGPESQHGCHTSLHGGRAGVSNSHNGGVGGWSTGIGDDQPNYSLQSVRLPREQVVQYAPSQQPTQFELPVQWQPASVQEPEEQLEQQASHASLHGGRADISNSHTGGVDGGSTGIVTDQVCTLAQPVGQPREQVVQPGHPQRPTQFFSPIAVQGPVEQLEQQGCHANLHGGRAGISNKHTGGVDGGSTDIVTDQLNISAQFVGREQVEQPGQQQRATQFCSPGQWQPIAVHEPVQQLEQQGCHASLHGGRAGISNWRYGGVGGWITGTGGDQPNYSLQSVGLPREQVVQYAPSQQPTQFELPVQWQPASVQEPEEQLEQQASHASLHGGRADISNSHTGGVDGGSTGIVTDQVCTLAQPVGHPREQVVQPGHPQRPTQFFSPIAVQGPVEQLEQQGCHASLHGGRTGMSNRSTGDVKGWKTGGVEAWNTGIPDQTKKSSAQPVGLPCEQGVQPVQPQQPTKFWSPGPWQTIPAQKPSTIQVQKPTPVAEPLQQWEQPMTLETPIDLEVEQAQTHPQKKARVPKSQQPEVGFAVDSKLHKVRHNAIIKPKHRRLPEMPKFMRKHKQFVNYWEKRYSLFSRFDEGIRLDRESWYSVTPEKIAMYQSTILSTDTIVDGFCGCGGNAIQFARTCKKVIAIDIDPEKLANAKHNAIIYGVAEKIEFICGDFLELCESGALVADMVFLSPPWGGPEYKYRTRYNIEAHLQPVGATELMQSARRISENIGLYLPRNTNRSQLTSIAGEDKRYEIHQHYVEDRIIAITVCFGEARVTKSGEMVGIYDSYA